ncbi:hypothetical protein COY27_04655 [Candidatus Woesearchaeota archaeon CG_4_10_14_0_2_um_filter_33_13]|nr:MAG: hypothetical protein COY27_04655 [Candidatus Woesearchaeota archaeon CG_4_10_14_0_2_um_filter_33_13]
MKILSNNSYEELTKRLKEFEDENDTLRNQVDGLRGTVQNLHNELENLTIRRLIVGRNGSGKSHYLKNVIIPQLNGNYFLIDPLDEHDSIPDSLKLSNCVDTIEILNAINKNQTKVIIIDNASIVCREDKNRLLGFISNRTSQFVLIYNSYKEVEWLSHYVSLIYSFGATDGFTFTSDNFNDKIILKKFKA